MGVYATYRAVGTNELEATLADEDPDIGALIFDAIEGEGEPVIDLTNTFDALAFILAGPTGDPYDVDDPLIAAVRGHHDVRPDSPSYNDQEWVQTIAGALEVFDPAHIAARFDPAAMEQLGLEPGGFAEDPQQWQTVITESLRTLRDLYRHAADNDLVVIADVG